MGETHIAGEWNRVLSAGEIEGIGEALARHMYANGDPDEIAKALRLDWERDEADAEVEADRTEVLERMIADAIRVAVREGISDE